MVFHHKKAGWHEMHKLLHFSVGRNITPLEAFFAGIGAVVLAIFALMGV